MQFLKVGPYRFKLDVNTLQWYMVDGDCVRLYIAGDEDPEKLIEFDSEQEAEKAGAALDAIFFKSA